MKIKSNFVAVMLTVCITLFTSCEKEDIAIDPVVENVTEPTTVASKAAPTSPIYRGFKTEAERGRFIDQLFQFSRPGLFQAVNYKDLPWCGQGETTVRNVRTLIMDFATGPESDPYRYKLAYRSVEPELFGELKLCRSNYWL